MRFIIAAVMVFAFPASSVLAQSATAPSTTTAPTDAELQAARLACNPHVRFNGQRQWVYDSGWEQCAKIIDEMNRRSSASHSETERQQMLDAAGRIK